MQKSSFFNAIMENGVPDRTYLAEDFASYFASFIGNGVFPLPSTCLQVIANGDMTVAVKAGSAWINGYYYINTDDLTFTLTIADGVLKRIDRLVVRCDFAEREISIVVKQGEYSNNPVAKELQRDADAYELGIADIFVSNGAISITQSAITDLRLSNTYCGYVTGIIKQVETTTIFNQFSTWYAEFTSNFANESNTWKSQFESNAENWEDKFQSEATSWRIGEEQAFKIWLENLKNMLDENVAANLQNQITNIVENGTDSAKNADTLDGKHASDFATASHTHTIAQISDMPTSMPANGGNADTVDNFHSWQLQNLGGSGDPETTYVKSQWAGTTKGFYLSADNGTGASMVRTVSVRMADTLYGVSSTAPTSPQTNDLWIW
jgi:hypothetical protein